MVKENALRVIFIGTPELSVPFLDFLFTQENVVAVLTRPDRLAGRGYHCRPSPVKERAGHYAIPLFQPEQLDYPEFIQTLADLRPELGVVVAYGKLIPPAVFNLPRYRCLNIHFSLLPRYRGAAPVQWALLNGEAETGVSIFQVEAELDNGDLLAQSTIKISPLDTTATLTERLIPLGLELLSQVVNQIKQRSCRSFPQTGAVRYAPALKKENGRIRWSSENCQPILNRIRACYPWPVAFTSYPVADVPGGNKELKIIAAELAEGEYKTGLPGSIVNLVKGRGFVIKSKDNKGILLRTLQPAGKQIMSAWDFWQGAHLELGGQLGGGQ